MTDFRGFWPFLKVCKIISSAYILAEDTIMFAANLVRTWLVVWITIDKTSQKRHFYIFLHTNIYIFGYIFGKGLYLHPNVEDPNAYYWHKLKKNCFPLLENSVGFLVLTPTTRFFCILANSTMFSLPGYLGAVIHLIVGVEWDSTSPPTCPLHVHFGGGGGLVRKPCLLKFQVGFHINGIPSVRGGILFRHIYGSTEFPGNITGNTRPSLE